MSHRLTLDARVDRLLERFPYLGKDMEALRPLVDPAAFDVAEKAGVGEVDLPPIYIHHHAKTWKLEGKATRTTEPPKP
jgi:hypothetical protein